jgi:hypothetical protein
LNYFADMACLSGSPLVVRGRFENDPHCPRGVADKKKISKKITKQYFRKSH